MKRPPFSFIGSQVMFAADAKLDQHAVFIKKPSVSYIDSF